MEESTGRFSAELLKMQKSGQFPDDLVKTEGAQIRCVASNIRHKGDIVISDSTHHNHTCGKSTAQPHVRDVR
jgi:hypothetical protein